MMKNLELMINLSLLLMIYIFFIFMMINIHPITMILKLIMYSLLICLIISIWKKNFMYSIIIFLIMISGLLIMFLYFASLISNEQLSFTKKRWIIIILILNSSWFYIMNLQNNSTYFTHLKNLPKMINLNMINNIEFSNIILIYKFPFNNLTIIAMFYLLLTLFTIIKLCMFMPLSLRKIN